MLACLALRYDASRAVDMRTRGVAVAAAMQEALESLEVRAPALAMRSLLPACLPVCLSFARAFSRRALSN